MSTRPTHESRDISRFESLEPRVLLSGTSYLVNSLADVVGADGVVTLREAIEAANTNLAVNEAAAGSATETDVITFDQSALQIEAGLGNPLIITLGGTQLEITDDLDIQGLGDDVLTVDANDLSRVLAISGSATEVDLNGLAITGGYVGAGNGGGIYNEGLLTVQEATITGNVADRAPTVTEVVLLGSGGGIYNEGILELAGVNVSGNTGDGVGIDVYPGIVALVGGGGGIYNAGGTVTLTDSTVSDNTSRIWGAGIYNDLGTVTVTDSTISGNSAINRGGGIYGKDGTLTVTDSTISDNSALYGGGIYSRDVTLTMTNSVVSGNSAEGAFDGSGGGMVFGFREVTATITNCIISGNTAPWQGGGILDYSASLTIVNSLIVGNSAGHEGGGMHGTPADTTLINVTVAGNEADDLGGGIRADSGSVLTLNNTIVAMNVATTGADVSGIYTSNNSMVGGDPGFIRNPSPGLDGIWGTPDDDYGDLRLLETSPAVNTGDNTLLPADEFDLDGDGDTVEPLPVDMVGNRRIRYSIVDMGAYEFAIPGDANYDGKVDGADFGVWQRNYDPLGLNGAANTWELGDWNGDGKINGADLALWQQNYDPLGTGDIADEAVAELSPTGGLALEPTADEATEAVTIEAPQVAEVVLIEAGEDLTPGDANGDGRIDGADLAQWAQNYDPVGEYPDNTWQMGDWNGDAKIDGADLALWQQNYNPLGIGDVAGGTGEDSVARDELALQPIAEEAAPLTVATAQQTSTGTSRSFLSSPEPVPVSPSAIIVIETDDDLTPGDANGDGRIDGADLAVWQINYDPLGTNANTWEMGDWNEDGKIDGADLGLW